MSDHHTIQSILLRDKPILETALNLEASTARIEVQCLLQAVLQVNRAYLLTYPERMLNADDYARYCALFERRKQGEPIAYLLQEREFFGLNFRVTPATLIPRPDTELLVALALERIPSPLPLSRLQEREEHSGFRVLDLGTGTGAIAIAIAHSRPDVEVVAVDASVEALEVARFNARQLNAGNVSFLQSDWFSALSGERFDLIVSNPPYIETGDAHLTMGDVRFEPPAALASGADGLDDIRRIIEGSRPHLEPGGSLMFEHGYNQAERVRQLLQQAGFDRVGSALDLAGIERVTFGNA